MTNKTMNEIVDDVMNDTTDGTSFIIRVTAIVKRQWVKEWGERCLEYEPECPCCVAWRKFDEQWG